MRNQANGLFLKVPVDGKWFYTVLFQLAVLTAFSVTYPEQTHAKQRNTGAPVTTHKESEKKISPIEDSAVTEAVGEKLLAYISCYNNVDLEIRDIITVYTAWFDNMDTGPTGHEEDISGIKSLDIERVNNCKAGIEKAVAKNPEITKLDAAAISYGDVIVALGEVIDSAHVYYDHKDYKDDGFTKGKKLHFQLIQSLKQFYPVSTRFFDALKAENNKYLEADLKRLEKSEGRSMQYFHTIMMHRAMQLIEVIGNVDFSAEIAAQRLAAYEASFDELVGFNKRNGESGYNFKINQAEEFLKASKERVRRIRDEAPSEAAQRQSIMDSDWQAEGSKARVLSTYNQMVIWVYDDRLLRMDSSRGGSYNNVLGTEKLDKWLNANEK